MSTTRPGGGSFELVSERLGSLPVLDHFLSRIGFDERLGRHLPKNDQRLRLSPGQVAGVLVRNIVIRHRPLYAIGEWACSFDPALLGLSSGDAGHLNDDRVGRTLDRLFDADRASLLTETVLGAVANFEIDCSELHNDSTTVSFTGNGYDEAGPATRGGRSVPVVTHGHNKDFRPDLLTELLKLFPQFRALRLASWFMVPARGRRQQAQGSHLVGGAIGRHTGGFRRPVGALSAA